MNTTIATIRRYPVKGLSAEELSSVEVAAGCTLPYDRHYALMSGAAALDAVHSEGGPGAWRPKSEFLTLLRHEKLAGLETEFDADTQTLIVRRNGRPVSRGRLDQPMGRTLLEQFFAAFLADAVPGAPKIAEADAGIAFTDTRDAYVSLLNLASVRDLEERVAKRAIDPRRFRANLSLDGLPAWSERDLIGRSLRAGGARLAVVEHIGRCKATEVDPATGARDINVVQTLKRGYGHTQCGIYARVVEGGRIAQGDPVIIED